MGQQVSLEAAFDGYRERAAELLHENILLKVHVKQLEGELEQLRSDDPGPQSSPAGPAADRG
jgi:hypothetical protein